MDVKSSNKKLQRLYEKHWETLIASVPTNQEYSFPFLMDMNDGYAESPIKLMIVGQQTNKWNPDWCRSDFGWEPMENPVSTLMTVYRKFNRAVNYTNSPFWQAAHRLQEQTNPGSDRYGFMWSNLLRVDHKASRPTEIEDAICRVPLLAKEIGIVKPDVLVFFTGPEYEARLISTFEGISLKAVPGYPFKFLAQLIHPLLPLHSYRTYHPNYLSRQKMLKPIVDKIAEMVR